MRIEEDLIEAIFLARLNRFAATVLLNGVEENVHVPNSGRMRELLVPGTPVLLAARDAPHRKTAYELKMVYLGDFPISVDARLPNALVAEALRNKALPEFAHYAEVRREVTYGRSRLDFLAVNENQRCMIEVKSVTLVVDGRGLFPDAVTQRGAEHMRALMRYKHDGNESAVIFVIQRADARVFSPHDATDPHFGSALREAARGGVGVYAYGCRVSRREIYIDKSIPVEL